MFPHSQLTLSKTTLVGHFSISVKGLESAFLPVSVERQNSETWNNLRLKLNYRLLSESY